MADGTPRPLGAPPDTRGDEFARVILACVAGLALCAFGYGLALRLLCHPGGPPIWLPPVVGSMLIAVVARAISPRHPFLAALGPLLLPAVTFSVGSRGWGATSLRETALLSLWLLLFGAVPGLLVLAATALAAARRGRRPGAEASAGSGKGPERTGL